MGIKMNILTATTNLAQRNIALQSNIDALQELKTGLEQYIANDELQSEAYESHKNYIQMMQIPVVDGLIMLCQTLIEANKRYQSIIGSTAPATLIDQDVWEKILAELIEEYNYLYNQASELESEQEYEIIYSAVTGTGKKYDSKYVIDSIHIEIYLIYTLINDYKTKLQKLEEMMNQINGIYGQVAMLSEAVSNAIDLLNSVPVNAEGYYATFLMNMEPIRDLKEAMVSCELADIFKEEIGEDTYQALINGELSEEKINEVLVIATGLGYGQIVKYIGELGHYEYHIYPNITVYAETTCSAEFGTELPVNVEMSIEEDAEYLINTVFSVENWETEVGLEGVGFNFSTQIDDNSEYYNVFLTNISETSVEFGVNSFISDTAETGEITTTVATGATYTPGGFNDWQPAPVDDYDYVDVPIPEVEVELQPITNEDLIYEPDNDGNVEIGLFAASLVLFVISVIEPSPVIILPVP